MAGSTEFRAATAVAIVLARHLQTCWSRVSGKYLGRNRTTIRIGQKTEHDLLLSLLAIAIVAEFGKLVLGALYVAAAYPSSIKSTTLPFKIT